MNKLHTSDFFAYVGEITQKPLLSEAEIKDLLLKGERSIALETIVSRTLRLVCHHVFRWSSFALRHGIQLEDLAGAGNIGLIMGVMKYSYKKGYFYNYTSKFIKAYILNEVFSNFGYPRRVCLKRMKQHEGINPTVSLDTVVSDNEENAILLQDVLPHPEDKRVHLTLEVANLLSELRKDHKATHRLSHSIIEMRYAVGSRKGEKALSLTETAKLFKHRLSKEGVRKVEQQAIGYMRSL